MLDVVLKRDRDRTIRRRHPWILSGAVDRSEGPAEPGAWARVRSSEGEVLGFGHWSPQSQLRVRILAFGKEDPGEAILHGRIAASIARRTMPLLEGTDALRLVNAEGDGLPGLVVDRYADVLVAKLTTPGMDTRRDAIVSALREATHLPHGFERADSAAARREGLSAHDAVLWGERPAGPVPICERGRRYRVDVREGQKTGFYLDQRDSRDLVERLASGRRVLDLYSYTGGFAVAAARGGAASVTAVESSAAGLALAGEHLAANAAGLDVRLERADVHRFLRSDSGTYDLLIVDPPPLARQKRDVQRAARAYKDVLLHAFRLTSEGAFVLAFACSHHVGPDLFRKITFGAALDARRSVRVLQSLGAPADHPVSLDHPEGAYLTGVLLQT